MIKKCLALALLSLSAAAQSATLSGTYTVDDYATVYLSTDLLADNSEIISDKPLELSGSGLPIGWMTPAFFADVALVPGQSYYLLVHAQNFALASSPAMFVGEFDITGSGFVFGNGQQRLLTNTTDWMVNETGFDAPSETPFSAGDNTGWFPKTGGFDGIAAEAQMIWPYEANFATGYGGSAYFIAQITAVPEPETAFMLLAGLGLIGSIARRKASIAC